MAFDMDGTLASIGKHKIPKELVEALNNLPKDIKLTVCTGRPLSYLKPHLAQFNRPWDAITENGGIIYLQDDKGNFNEFHRVKWPEETPQEEVAKMLKKASGFLGQVRKRESNTTVAFYWLEFWRKLMERMSKWTNRRIKKQFKKRGWDKHLKVFDSGIGNLLLPKASGKGNAVELWAKYHGIKHENLLCAGDRAQAGGNDAEMLNDTRWHGYSVGADGEHSKPVLDEDGNKLQGPEAVLTLVQTYFQE